MAAIQARKRKLDERMQALGDGMRRYDAGLRALSDGSPGASPSASPSRSPFGSPLASVDDSAIPTAQQAQEAEAAAASLDVGGGSLDSIPGVRVIRSGMVETGRGSSWDEDEPRLPGRCGRTDGGAWAPP